MPAWVLGKEFKFEAAHQLLEHGGQCRRLHGHSYRFKLEIRGDLITSGSSKNMVVDYGEISPVGKAIEERLDHRFLNEVMQEEMPTAEFIARWIFEEAKRYLPLLCAVDVSETANTWCRYCPAEARLYELGQRELRRMRLRLFKSVEVGPPGACWPFTGAKDEQGYGYSSSVMAGTSKAHRLVMWLEGHDISNRCVLHRCDNPPCCNPAHLFLGDHEENEADKDEKGRRPKGEDHYLTSLTEEQVGVLWAAHAGGPVAKGFAAEWAARLGTTTGTVSNILNGWTWNHITGLPKR